MKDDKIRLNKILETITDCVKKFETEHPDLDDDLDCYFATGIYLTHNDAVVLKKVLESYLEN